MSTPLLAARRPKVPVAISVLMLTLCVLAKPCAAGQAKTDAPPADQKLAITFVGGDQTEQDLNSAGTQTAASAPCPTTTDAQQTKQDFDAAMARAQKAAEALVSAQANQVDWIHSAEQEEYDKAADLAIAAWATYQGCPTGSQPTVRQPGSGASSSGEAKGPKAGSESANPAKTNAAGPKVYCEIGGLNGSEADSGEKIVKFDLRCLVPQLFGGTMGSSEFRRPKSIDLKLNFDPCDEESPPKRYTFSARDFYELSLTQQSGQDTTVNGVVSGPTVIFPGIPFEPGDPFTLHGLETTIVPREQLERSSTAGSRSNYGGSFRYQPRLTLSAGLRYEGSNNSEVFDSPVEFCPKLDSLSGCDFRATYNLELDSNPKRYTLSDSTFSPRRSPFSCDLDSLNLSPAGTGDAQSLFSGPLRKQRMSLEIGCRWYLGYAGLNRSGVSSANSAGSLHFEIAKPAGSDWVFKTPSLTVQSPSGDTSSITGSVRGSSIDFDVPWQSKTRDRMRSRLTFKFGYEPMDTMQPLPPGSLIPYSLDFSGSFEGTNDSGSRVVVPFSLCPRRAVTSDCDTSLHLKGLWDPRDPAFDRYSFFGSFKSTPSKRVLGIDWALSQWNMLWERAAAHGIEAFANSGANPQVADGPQVEGLLGGKLKAADSATPATPPGGLQRSPGGNDTTSVRGSSRFYASSLDDAGAHFLLASFLPSSLRPPFSSRQAAEAAAGAAKQLSYSFIANGSASGDAFELRVVDPSGQLDDAYLPDGLVLEPLEQGALKPVEPGPGAKMRVYKVTAFCVQYAKAPPNAQQLYRVASADAQEQYGDIGPVIRAGHDLAEAHAFTPDTEESAYAIYTQQYAVWAFIQHWNQEQFAEVFREKTKAIVEASGVKWNSQLDQSLMALVPGRWRDIQKVLARAAQLSAAERPAGSAAQRGYAGGN